jgi:NADH-quinone oxidoreductase subunit E
MTFSPELEARFEKLLASYPRERRRSALVPMLLYAQDEAGSVTPELVGEVARRLELQPAEVASVASYYSMLRQERPGKHHIQICTNVSCQLAGGAELFEHACRRLGIGHREATPDGRFSLEEVECLGACCWAPAVMVNYEYHHGVTPEQFDRLIEALRQAD